MISLTAARALIAEQVSPLRAITGTLSEAAGHILREDVSARADLPGFDRSAMDGYALAAADPAERFRIVMEIQPGAPARRRLGAGECARIFTGAPIPAGASQVIPQENVRVDGVDMVPVERNGPSHIRHRGEDARKGDLLLRAGIRLGAGEVSLLASLGVTHPKISPPIRVLHFTTGNELVDAGSKPRVGQVRDSNGPLVAAFLQQVGATALVQDRVPDDFGLLQKKVRARLKACDLVLLSGGASVGEHDFGKRLLMALGFQIHFATINLRPGKPLVFATRGRQVAFVIPGNPVSHLVTLHVAVRAAVQRLGGANPAWPLVRMRLADAAGLQPNARESFLPARASVNADGELVVRSLRWQSSGDVTGLTEVNALLQLPANAAEPKAGDAVSVLMLEVPS